MVRKRHVYILTSLAITSLILTQFQNCAPPSSSGTTAASGGEERIVDDWNKTEIQFASPEVQVHDEAVVAGIDGMCTRQHNGASLRWAVWTGDRSGAPIMGGASSCKSGRFEVKVEQLPDMVCGVKHLLVVEGDWGGSTFTHIVRRCQPLATESVAAPESSPAGTVCSLEYSPASEAGANCMQVCYRDDKMVLSQPVEKSQCSGIAAKLAGP